MSSGSVPCAVASGSQSRSCRRTDGPNQPRERFEVRSGSYIANYTILSYLIKYPLFSYKYVNVPVQIELLQLSKSKSYRTAEGLKFLTYQKAKMNFYSSSSLSPHPFPALPLLRLVSSASDAQPALQLLRRWALYR